MFATSLGTGLLAAVLLATYATVSGWAQRLPWAQWGLSYAAIGMVLMLAIGAFSWQAAQVRALRMRVVGLSSAARRIEQEAETRHRLQQHRLSSLEDHNVAKTAAASPGDAVPAVADAAPSSSSAWTLRSLQDSTGVGAVQIRTRMLGRASGDERHDLEALMVRLDLLEVEVAALMEGIRGPASFSQDTARDEKLWLELQRLMRDLRELEESRLRDAHFRAEVESFQERLAQDHQRLEDQVLRLAVFQSELEQARAELFRLREEARSFLVRSRELCTSLEKRAAVVDDAGSRAGNAVPGRVSDDGAADQTSI